MLVDKDENDWHTFDWSVSKYIEHKYMSSHASMHE